MAFLTGLHVKNYRSLADVEIRLEPVNVLFGPNGAGKSSILDALWFLQNAVAASVETAMVERDRGSLLWAATPEGSPASIQVQTAAASYRLTLDTLGGDMDTFVGEFLTVLRLASPLIERARQATTVVFYNETKGFAQFSLRDPTKTTLTLYLDLYPESAEAGQLDELIRSIRLYHCRPMKLDTLRKFGSERSSVRQLNSLGDNLWSVLRNLSEQRTADDGYETIIGYMKRCFPSFADLVLDVPNPSSVYGSIRENGLRDPVRASAVADGHLQMLILLTALFGEGRNHPAVILFDEPELSLHPWALAVLAEAIDEAAARWQRQVLIATHSPVLLSQFDASRVLAVEPGPIGTRVRRLSEIAEVSDLLEQYAAGSLYMADVIGRQATLVD